MSDLARFCAWILPRKIGAKRQILSPDNGDRKRSLLLENRFAVFTGCNLRKTSERVDPGKLGAWQARLTTLLEITYTAGSLVSDMARAKRLMRVTNWAIDPLAASLALGSDQSISRG